jgi:hypothetical protein
MARHLRIRVRFPDFPFSHCLLMAGRDKVRSEFGVVAGRAAFLVIRIRTALVYRCSLCKRLTASCPAYSPFQKAVQRFELGNSRLSD